MEYSHSHFQNISIDEFDFSQIWHQPEAGQHITELHQPHTILPLESHSVVDHVAETGSLQFGVELIQGGEEDAEASVEVSAAPKPRACPLSSLPKAARPNGPLDEVWEQWKEVIIDLYWTEEKPLPEVMSIMKSEHGFCASEKQYKTQLKLWNIGKNMKTQEAEAMISIQVHRLANHGKDTAFRLRKRPVPPQKLIRYSKRRKIEPIVRAKTPSDISYFTPDEQSGSGDTDNDMTPKASPCQRPSRSTSIAERAIMNEFSLDDLELRTPPPIPDDVAFSSGTVQSWLNRAAWSPRVIGQPQTPDSEMYNFQPDDLLVFYETGIYPDDDIAVITDTLSRTHISNPVSRFRLDESACLTPRLKPSLTCRTPSGTVDEHRDASGQNTFELDSDKTSLSSYKISETYPAPIEDIDCETPSANSSYSQQDPSSKARATVSVKSQSRIVKVEPRPPSRASTNHQVEDVLEPALPSIDTRAVSHSTSQQDLLEKPSEDPEASDTTDDVVIENDTPATPMSGTHDNDDDDESQGDEDEDMDELIIVTTVVDKSNDEDDDELTAINAASYEQALRLAQKRIAEVRPEGDLNLQLRFAAKTGDIDTLKSLIQRGANVNCQGKSGMRPLHLAAYMGHTKVVAELLNNGAINFELDGEMTFRFKGYNKAVKQPCAIVLSAIRGHFEATHILIQDSEYNPGDIDDDLEEIIELDFEEFGYSFLESRVEWDVPVTVDCCWSEWLIVKAVEGGRESILGDLITEDIKLRNRCTDCPGIVGLFMSLAIRNEYKVVCLRLIRLTANIRSFPPAFKSNNLQQEAWVEDWLHVCIRCNNPWLIKLLIEHGADVNGFDKAGNLPLHVAIRYNRPRLVELLVELGADLNRPGKGGHQPLYAAVTDNHGALVPMFVNDNREWVDGVNDKRTPLFRLPRKVSWVAMLRPVMERFASQVSAEGNPGQARIAELRHAVALGDEKLAERLFSNGSPVNAPVLYVFTSLHVAIAVGHDEIVRFLLEAEASTNSRKEASTDSREEALCRTPMHVAVVQGDLKSISTLLREGADINAVDATGWTPLHLAIECGHSITMVHLVRCGANINTEEPTDWVERYYSKPVGLGLITNVHIAALRNDCESVEEMMDHRLSRKAFIDFFITILECAIYARSTALVSMLVARYHGSGNLPWLPIPNPVLPIPHTVLQAIIMGYEGSQLIYGYSATAESEENVRADSIIPDLRPPTDADTREMFDGIYKKLNLYPVSTEETASYLFELASTNRPLSLRRLLDCGLGTSYFARDSEGRTALHLMASKPTFVDIPVDILSFFRNNLWKARDNNGHLPLHYALAEHESGFLSRWSLHVAENKVESLLVIAADWDNDSHLWGISSSGSPLPMVSLRVVSKFKDCLATAELLKTGHDVEECNLCEVAYGRLDEWTQQFSGSDRSGWLT